MNGGLQTNTILPERKRRVREFVYRICVHSGAWEKKNNKKKKLVWSRDSLRTRTANKRQMCWFSIAV